jgi:hypothetical protein
MAFTRRNALKTLTFAGIVVFVPAASKAAPPSSPAAPAETPTHGLGITRSRLKPHVGESFRVETTGGSTVVLNLASVGDLPSAKAAGTAESDDSFELIFESTSGIMLSQGTYELQHAKLGTLTIFLVPVNLPSKTATYEAIFNQTKPKK